MSFWPDDIVVEQLLTPEDFLRNAGDELEGLTSNRLKVTVRTSVLSDRVVHGFEVRNVRMDKTLNLFEVSHLLETPYPVAIEPPESRIPEFLKRRRFVPGRKPLDEEFRSSLAGVTPDRFVENEWIAGTPAEFSRLLANLLARDDIKARIISLQCGDLTHGAAGEASNQ